MNNIMTVRINIKELSRKLYKKLKVDIKYDDPHYTIVLRYKIVIIIIVLIIKSYIFSCRQTM